MPKLGEINYLKALGAEGANHALNKPFADECCGRYLSDLGIVMRLLPEPPARVLDLGVGSGWTTAFLARRGYEVVGQDICEDMIELAEQNRVAYGVDTASFVVQDYESMAFRDEFDAAFFYDALHHAEDEAAALQAVYRALKPGGTCVTVEPGEGHALASQFAIERFGVTEKDMPPHHIIDVARRVGFREFRIYARPTEPQPVIDCGAVGSMASPEPSRWRVASGFLRKMVRVLLKGSRPPDVDYLFNLGLSDIRLLPTASSPGDVVHSARILRDSNIVWMRK